MSDELALGKMSIDEFTPSLMKIPKVSAEWRERYAALRAGAPGRAAMLSRAQVRACLGPLLMYLAPFEGQGLLLERWTNFNLGIHAASRALLNLATGEKSPIEED